MENASKALIIAASVLLTLMIIALGVTIFNRAQSSADTTSLDTTEINMFNQKFERYSGNQLGSQVKSLISFAISNASTNKDDPSQLPSIDFKGNEGGANAKATEKGKSDTNGLGQIRNSIISTHTYKVEVHYAETGLIDIITINYK